MIKVGEVYYSGYHSCFFIVLRVDSNSVYGRLTIVNSFTHMYYDLTLTSFEQNFIGVIYVDEH